MLATPLRGVVGDRTAKALVEVLGLRTVGDLLRHYPRRYAERGELTDLADLRVGEHVTVQAEVARLTRRPMRNRRSYLDVVVTDGRRSLSLTFFNQPWRERELSVGRRAFFAGKVEDFRGRRQLTNPECLVLGASGETAEDFAGALIPIYPAGARVSTWTIARCVRVVLDTLPELADPLPADLRRRHDLLELGPAFTAIHRPTSGEEVRRATTRLKWDEALLLQLTLAQRRAAAALLPATPRAARVGGLAEAFEAALPFTLTAGQRVVSGQLTAELASAHPMHRLLQGEVGSGKTVVALAAMLQVIDAGGQAALLAPTEVLASQHAASLRSLLGPLGIAGELGAAESSTRVVLLTGSLPAAARREVLSEVAGGAGVVVGTHALLEEAVSFRDLGLVVVDEQHRFGVEQREALRAKGGRPPHVLVMTATPIPRTVAMTVYGDLEVSTLTELPAGRSPIATTVVPAGDKPQWLDRVWQRLREEVAGGHQAFVVCPRIGPGPGERPDLEEGPGSGPGRGPDEETGWDEGTPGDAESRPAAAVLDVAAALAAGPLAGLRLGALHGRLASEDKDTVMGEFAAGRLDVMVATTVIEVGVDVPNATAMVVLDADRFGISALHQLRGRVGRGTAPGLCLLVTDAAAGTPGRQRLEAVGRTDDGFELARLDLEQRREGDVLGASQSGRRSGVRLLRLSSDESLILAARHEAIELVSADPELSGEPALAAAIAEALTPERAEFLEKA